MEDGGHPPFATITALSDSKLSTFIQHISSGSLTLPIVRHAFSQPSGPINVLKTLIPLYTSHVPWGGLSYHYSTLPINSLAPDDVFDKIIHRGHGGHCLEMVPLFASVMKALGYDFYMTGARVSSALAADAASSEDTIENENESEVIMGFHGWSHLILIATIDGKRYVVDPQFIDIMEPILLDPAGPDLVFKGIPGTVMRLRHCKLEEIIPNNGSHSRGWAWLFEYRRDVPEGRWTPTYMFSPETEWFLTDLDVMNVWLARAADSYLVARLIIKKVLVAGADGPGMLNGVSGVEENGLLKVPIVTGAVELADDHLRAWRGGEKVVDETVGTERERIEVLKSWFGIQLTKEEELAILKLPSALKHSLDN